MVLPTESLGDDTYSPTPFLIQPIACQKFLSHPCLILFSRGMILLQNSRRLRCHSPSGTSHLCVLQISLWELPSYTAQRTELFVSQHRPAADPSFLQIPLKTGSLSCHLVHELEQNSKVCYMLAPKLKEAFQILYFSLSGRRCKVQ